MRVTVLASARHLRWCLSGASPGVPLVYELDASLRPIRHYYLGNPEEIAAKMAAVAAQGAAKK
jgi:hypothetical protein